MRKKIVAGNWKMNNTLKEVNEFSAALQQQIQDVNRVEVVVAPAFPFITHLKTNSPEIKLAAQNCSHERSGAYTGEVSAAMLASAGVSYVIIGHSERRMFFGEKAEVLRIKADRLLENSLTPIYCVGEQKEEREEGKHFKVVSEQLMDVLSGRSVDDVLKFVIAYEPVWAIGTGLTATSEQAQEMHAYIRTQLADMFDQATANSISLIYGGSCKPSNAAELFDCEDVDGGLIGGASLEADSFMQIIRAAEGL